MIRLDCTIGNKARIGFSAREPKAIMMFELASDAMEDTERQADALIKDLHNLATHCLKFTVLILTK
jgi:hypothetical protein